MWERIDPQVLLFSVVKSPTEGVATSWSLDRNEMHRRQSKRRVSSLKSSSDNFSKKNWFLDATMIRWNWLGEAMLTLEEVTELLKIWSCSSWCVWHWILWRGLQGVQRESLSLSGIRQEPKKFWYVSIQNALPDPWPEPYSWDNSWRSIRCLKSWQNWRILTPNLSWSRLERNVCLGIK